VNIFSEFLSLHRALEKFFLPFERHGMTWKVCGEPAQFVARMERSDIWGLGGIDRPPDPRRSIRATFCRARIACSPHEHGDMRATY